uniref:uncharacterized protein rbbp8l n=1 Tax=Monopterus albus TaxID=43700 RepID=UPI0009B4B70B|nr:uncharacterized protein LOC109969993 [Monopterus albus]
MENKKLRDEIRNLRAGLDRCHTDHSSNSTATDVKPNSSPDLSPSSVPVALINAASSQPSSQPTDGDVVVKSKRTEEAEHRQLRGMSKSNFFSQESYKPFLLSSLITPSWKADHSGTRAGERRAQSVEGLDQRPSIPPQALLLKNASSSAGGDVIPSRHVLHAPVPCRPQPINSTRAVPWPLSESCDWVTATAAAAANLMPRPSSKTNPLCIPSLLPTSPRRQNIGSQWLKQSTLQTPAKEPTVVFRLRNLPEHVESQTKPQEKKEIPLPRVAAEGLREAYEGPLDLSDRGKSKSNQEPRDDSPLALQDVPRVEKSPDKNVKADPAAHVPISSPSPVIPPSSSTTPPVRQQEEEPTLDFNHKASTPAVELISSSDERDEEGNASSQSCKRKRASVETEPDRDSDTEDIRNERTIKITVRTEETGLS